MQDSWNAKVSSPEKIAGVVRRDHGDLSVGEVNTTLTVYNGNPRMFLLNGSQCGGSSEGLKASTVIDFICEKGEFVRNTPKLSAQLPPDDALACGFVIEWRTRFACPTSEDGAIGLFGSLLVMIVVLLMIYLVLGTLYNRFVLGLSGFDQIPQFSIDSAKYHLSNGLDYARDFVQTQRAPQTTQGVFQRGRPQANPYSHQATVNAMIDPNPSQQQSPTPTSSQRKPLDVEKGLAQFKPQEREFLLSDEDDEDEAGPSSGDAVGEPAKGMGRDGVIRL